MKRRQFYVTIFEGELCRAKLQGVCAVVLYDYVMNSSKLSGGRVV